MQGNVADLHREHMHVEVSSSDVIFDQAVYVKALKIIGTIGKRFQDAGLKDQCVESQVIAEGPLLGVLEGRKYNRA